MNKAAHGGGVMGSYLDHDHPQRIDVRFLADASLPAQDLWCGPSYGMVLVSKRGGSQIRNYGGKPEVRDVRTTRIVNKNAWLGHR